MEQDKIYAVITGDLVKSSSLGAGRGKILETVKEVLDYTGNFVKKAQDFILSSGIFRGDAFQLLISDYGQALKVALFIQASLLYKGGEEGAGARLALGLGKVESIRPHSIAESYGEAFLLSGRALDRIDSYRRLIIQSPLDEVNRHLRVLAACLDAITRHWTTEQAEAVALWLEGFTQQAAADRLKISQSAVQQRLQKAGAYALKEALEYFEWLLTGLYNITNNELHG